MKYLIWDFDATLGYREGRSWGVVLLEVLDRHMPGHAFVAEQIAPLLRTGFPWHTPERPHTHITSADEWWDALAPTFERVFLAVGIAPDLAQALARQVRGAYCNPARFRLFDDVLPTLDALAADGWTHILLSNHVPELSTFIEPLGLCQRLSAVFNSAEIGYEKPHPEAFRCVLATLSRASSIWMIGDNFQADYQGAAAVGIPAILVRRPNEAALRYSVDLPGVIELVSQSSLSPS